jgi:hypothetical protein
MMFSLLKLTERVERLERLVELDAKIAAVPQWGAALTALNEEREGVLRAIAEEHR